MSQLPHQVDPALHEEAVTLYRALDVQRYADTSTVLVNPPNAQDRLSIAGAIRAIGNSAPLHYLAPAAVTVSRLYFFVAFVEGVVQPHLAPLVELCKQLGHVGPGQAGRRQLEHASTKPAVAFDFLSGAGAATFASAPRLHAELAWAHGDRIAQFRNAVAHFKYRLDEVSRLAAENPSVKGLGSLAPLALRMHERLGAMLGLPIPSPILLPDYEKSAVHYEENMGRPLLPSSRRRSYPEVRKVVERIEKLGFSLLFAFLEAGVQHQKAGRLALGTCAVCRIGTVSAVPGTSVACPVCGNVGKVGHR